MQIVEFWTKLINFPLPLRSKKNAKRSRLPEAKTFRSLPGHLIEKHEIGLTLINQRKGIGLSGVERPPEQSPRAGLRVAGTNHHPAGCTG